ncbi:hypothetical protein [Arenibacter sp. F20364]|uniref:hypothetical protein n=1 Tax=Arenibacter sp. F20364 TaxID=2926415 RepID=UPI001FF11B2E|nr:hypothetical protein [Arenibacter sp. F20364]MCK0192269.1 hypothetical protein [Arenibacter sp. F20364]
MKDDTIEAELDKLMGKILKDEALDPPSLDFTAGVMACIQAVKDNPTTVYEPLISKKAWGILSVGLLLVFVYLLFKEDSSTGSMWLNNFEIPQLKLPNVFVSLPIIAISDTLVYGILAFTICVYVQIFVLKKYLDRRF